jgi:predicted peroxiredoxin
VVTSVADDLVLHVTDDPASERAHLAFRLGLVALAEHRDVTILLSADAVALAVARPDDVPLQDHQSITAMVSRFLDNGGRLCVLSASAHEHGLCARGLVEGAAIVSPSWVVDELCSGTATLTF